MFASLLTERILHRNQFVEIKDILYEWLVMVNHLQERGKIGVENILEEVNIVDEVNISR